MTFEHNIIKDKNLRTYLRVMKNTFPCHGHLKTMFDIRNMAFPTHDSNEKQRLIQSVLMPAIAQTVPLASSKLEHIAERLDSKGRFQYFKQDSIIEQPGSYIESYAHYIARGYARTYFYNFDDHSEKTTQFWKMKDIILSLDCYLERNERKHHVAAITDVYTFSLHYEEIEQLLFEIPELQTILDQLHSHRERMHNHHLRILSSSIDNMIKSLLTRYPRLEDSNQAYIASFLNRSRPYVNQAIARYNRNNKS